jgi:uncharacterized membrane protein HdeD (DUF308 family)
MDVSHIRNADPFDSFRRGITTRVEEFGRRWGWYFALGVFLFALGVMATGMSVVTTLVSVVVLGWVMLFAGAALVIHAFLTGKWSGFLLSLAAGILSGITGITLLRAPLSGAAALTLLLAAFFMVAGAFRAISSSLMRFPNWGWSLFSGIVTFGLGGILLAGWPSSSLWFLGLYIGIDLIVHGFAWVMFALSLRSMSKRLGEGRYEQAA